MSDLPHSLVHAFRDASEKFNDQVGLNMYFPFLLHVITVLLKEIHDCWNLLAEMVAIPNIPSEPLAARTSDQVLMSFVLEARRFLENRYDCTITNASHEPRDTKKDSQIDLY